MEKGSGMTFLPVNIFRGHTFEAEVSQLVMTSVRRKTRKGNRRRCSMELDGSKTARSVSEGWMAKLLVPVLQKNSRDVLLHFRAIQGHTGGNVIAPELMGHVAIPYKWKEFLFHRGRSCDVTSILSHDSSLEAHLLHTSQPIRGQSRWRRIWR